MAVTSQPKSIEDAIALISIDESFNVKAEYLIKSILKSHINYGSSEYKSIREDAVNEVTTNLLEMINAGDVEHEWYKSALDTYGTSNCALTRYIYSSVKNYAKVRYDRWTTSKGGIRGRVIMPNHSENKNNNFEQWLCAEMADLPNNYLSEEDPGFDIDDLLNSAFLSREVIQILRLRSEGHTFEEIGQTLCINRDSARMKFNRAKPIIIKLLARLKE